MNQLIYRRQRMIRPFASDPHTNAMELVLSADVFTSRRGNGFAERRKRHVAAWTIPSSGRSRAVYLPWPRKWGIIR